MNIKKKIIISFASMLFLMVFIGLYNYKTMVSAQTSLENMANFKTHLIHQNASLSLDIDTLETKLIQFIYLKNSDELNTQEKSIKQLMTNINKKHHSIHQLLKESNNLAPEIMETFLRVKTPLKDLLAYIPKFMLEKKTHEETDSIKRLYPKINTFKSQQAILNDKLNQSLSKQSETANKTVTQVVLHQFIALALSIMLAGIIGWFLIRSIIKPLNEVLSTIRKIGKGDLTQRMDDSRNDEIGQLAKGVNHLTQSLQQILVEINHAIDAMMNVCQETGEAVSKTGGYIASQVAEAAKVATAMHESETTISEIAHNTDQTLVRVEKINATSSHGSKIMRDTIAHADNVSQLINNSSDLINQLQNNVINIGSILDVIRGIAEQTNLLALNAAIEAARAGEQGRGFAVVADEVRTLASRTQESTQQIQEMIEALQSGSKEAVVSMDNSVEKVIELVKQTKDSEEILELIDNGVSHLFEMASMVASATEEQSSTIKETSNNIQRVSQLADETASAVGDTAKLSSQLANVATNLQRLIAKFKLC